MYTTSAKKFHPCAQSENHHGWEHRQKVIQVIIMQKKTTLRPEEREILVDAGGVIFRGRRENNEDCFCANEYWLKARNMSQNQVMEQKRKLKKGVYGVFDGVGGDPHGEWASCAAAEFFSEHHAQVCDQIRTQETATALFQEANQAIYAEAKGSCSTAVVLGISDLLAYIAYVGDSSAFLWRKGELSCLTKPHKPEASGNRHSINRYLGEIDEERMYTPSVCPRLAIVHDDIFVLCSDGVTDALTNERLGETIDPSAASSQIASQIAKNAYTAGSNDNITVLVLKVQLA